MEFELNSHARRTAELLLEIEAVKFNADNPFRLASGRQSPVYIDCRRIISFPQARSEISDMLVELISREVGEANIDNIAGGETAGIPFAALAADRMNLPMSYIRKKPKGHGRMARIEGDVRLGQRVLLVEDLATDGGSKLSFVEAIRDAGADCNHIAVVFHYGIFPNAEAKLARNQLRIHRLCTWQALLKFAEGDRLVDERTMLAVREFLDAPENWRPAS